MAPRAALLLLAAAAALALVCGASADDVAKSPGDGAAADAAAGGAGAAVKTYEYFVIPSQCVSRFLDNKDFFDATCNKLLISRLLSISITSLAWVLKAPQAFKILKSGSTAGLDATAHYFDFLVFFVSSTSSFVQGLNFASYGESVAIMIQNAGLVLLLWSFNPDQFSMGHRLTAVLIGAACAVPTAYFPLEAYSATVALTVISRGSQLRANWAQGHTGQLALATVLLQFAGGVARIFTSMQDELPRIMQAGFIIGATLSGVLMAQIFLYWDATKAEDERIKAAREAKKGKKETETKKDK